MKKVIFNKEENTINVDELTDSHFIGVVFVNNDIGNVTKLDKNQYILGLIIYNNEYDVIVSFDSIESALNYHSVKEVYATLYRTEFIQWYTNQLNTLLK